MKRFALVFPALSLPILLSLPASFNLYWISSSLLHGIALNTFQFAYVRRKLGIPNYYPGTKLEKLIQGKIFPINILEKKLKELEDLKTPEKAVEKINSGLRRTK